MRIRKKEGVGFKLFSEGSGKLQMGNEHIPNKGTAAEMWKANNLVWQKHRLCEENHYRRTTGEGPGPTALGQLRRQAHLNK